MGQKVKAPLERFVELFGGHLTLARQHGWPFYYYRQHGKKALIVLREILPFLVVKKTAAELGVAFQNFHNVTKPQACYMGRADEEVSVLDNFYEGIKYLNKKHSPREEEILPEKVM